MRRIRTPLSLIAALSLVVAFGVAHIGARAQEVLPCDTGNSGDYTGGYATVSQPGPYGMGGQEIVELDSNVDGATIQMGLFRPLVPAGVKVPVILTAGPYYHALQTLDLRACAPFLTENYVVHGYAVAILAVRGTGDSGGCMNMFGIDERRDIDQAITWLGSQSWSNGSVGMIGLSYDGGTVWEGASFGNPYLKTIVPVSGVNDLFELMYGGAQVDFRGPVTLNALYYAQSLVFFVPGRSLRHTIDVTTCPEYAVAAAAATYSSVTGELDPFGYWGERRFRPEIEANYRGSVYVVQGLQDWNVNPGLQYPWISELEARGVYVKHLLGQWGHAYPYSSAERMDWADVLLDWLDHWLKDDPSAPLGNRIEVQDSAGLWRAATAWPDGTETTYWLNPGHGLASAPSTTKSAELVTLDPLHMQAGIYVDLPPAGLGATCLPANCASFETPVFGSEYRFAGLPEIDLDVVPLGPGGQLSAYLYAVTGRQAKRLGWGQFDLRFRSGSGAALPVTPGKVLSVTFALQPLDTVVPAGARLLLVLSEGSTGGKLPGSLNFPMLIRAGAGQSRLRLVTVNPAPEDFFTP